MGNVVVYNIKTEDHSADKCNYYIGRPSIFGNPFTHNKGKSKYAKLEFKTRDEAIDAYKPYFEKMVETDKAFKETFDKMYEQFKNCETIYLGCFCKPLRCHGDIIKDELQKRFIKEKIEEHKKGLKKA